MWFHGRMWEALGFIPITEKKSERKRNTNSRSSQGVSPNPKLPSVQPDHFKLLSVSTKFLNSLFFLSLSFSPKEKVSTCSQCQMKMRQISQVTGWSSHIFWWISVPASQLARLAWIKSDSKPHKYKYLWVGKCQKQRKLLQILNASSFTLVTDKNRLVCHQQGLWQWWMEAFWNCECKWPLRRGAGIWGVKEQEEVVGGRTGKEWEPVMCGLRHFSGRTKKNRSNVAAVT